jgi:hypothetical protein
MNKKSWRKELELDIEESLSELLNETKSYKNAISKADDKGKAQLWVAMAILNSKLNEISLHNQPEKKVEKKLSEKDLKKLLKALESY